MNPLNALAILLVAFVVVYLESAVTWPRRLVGAQVDLLPALMVYCGLYADMVTLSLLAVCGGLWFDSLSANPLGISIVPLFVIGFLIFRGRDLVLRELPFAQFCFGLAASAAAPVFTLLALYSSGEAPLIGWGSLWQWGVMTAGGAVFTPLFVRLFERFNRAFSYPPAGETSFRADREIKRGR
jgi:hypothetical protein